MYWKVQVFKQCIWSGIPGENSFLPTRIPGELRRSINHLTPPLFVFFKVYWICYKIVSALPFGFLAMRHAGFSSPTRDQICTPYIGRRSLNHQGTIREVPSHLTSWLISSVLPDLTFMNKPGIGISEYLSNFIALDGYCNIVTNIRMALRGKAAEPGRSGI